MASTLLDKSKVNPVGSVIDGHQMPLHIECWGRKCWLREDSVLPVIIKVVPTAMQSWHMGVTLLEMHWHVISSLFLIQCCPLSLGKTGWDACIHGIDELSYSYMH